MNKILAEVRIDNILTPFIHISKSSKEYSRQKEYEEAFDLLLSPQGFIWYQDFIAFNMLSDIKSYWVKIAVGETLEIDPIITDAIKRPRNSFDGNVIVLPFQVVEGDRLYVFGDDDALILSFTLPAGHYQLLFQNRFFTREEIEASPNNDCKDLEYDDWDDFLELCMLTFIPTQEVIEPKFLVYKGSKQSKTPPTPLILFDRKLYEDSND